MRIRFVVFAIATFGMVTLGQTPVPKQPSTIVLTTEKWSVDIDSHVNITLQRTNTSDHEIPLGWWGQDNLGVIDIADMFDVRDSRGHLLKRKERSQNSHLMGNLAAVTSVKPGQTRSYVQDLARWYDLSRPGTYTIQVSRPFSENGKDGVVKSNKLTITITP